MQLHRWSFQCMRGDHTPARPVYGAQCTEVQPKLVTSGPGPEVAHYTFVDLLMVLALVGSQQETK